MTAEERKIKIMEGGLYEALGLIRQLKANRATGRRGKTHNKRSEKPQDASSLVKMYMDKLNNKMR